jgi:hypothetical protein
MEGKEHLVGLPITSVQNKYGGFKSGSVASLAQDKGHSLFWAILIQDVFFSFFSIMAILSNSAYRKPFKTGTFKSPYFIRLKSLFITGNY